MDRTMKERVEALQVEIQDLHAHFLRLDEGAKVALKFREDRIAELEQELFQARDERDEYITRASAEEMLKEEALYDRAARQAFIPGLFFAVGFALASLLWWIF